MENNLIDRQTAIDALTHKWDGMVTSVFDVINSLPSAQPDVPDTNVGDMISRQTAIEELDRGAWGVEWDKALAKAMLESLPSAQPERKKMSNKEWVDFLSEQFTVSRTSAREMLHGLMRWKAEDNFKKQFSGGRNEKE